MISGKELKPAGDGASTSVPGSSVEEYNDTVELDEKALPQKELRTLLTQPKVPYVIEGFVDVRGMKKPFRFAGEMAFPR